MNRGNIKLKPNITKCIQIDNAKMIISKPHELRQAQVHFLSQATCNFPSRLGRKP
jgi:hypothetical protein